LPPTTPPPQRLRPVTWWRFGLFPVRSPLLGESRLISLPPGTEMFHFPGFAAGPYGFRSGSLGMTPAGFPHSDSSGSTPVSDSPELFAARRVLLRLLLPRHSPSALCRLNLSSSLLQKAFRLPGRFPFRKVPFLLFPDSVVNELPLPSAALWGRAVRQVSLARCGGDERDRTADLLRARQALSRLSYIPPDGGPG
jgi:hypothetical protein